MSVDITKLPKRYQDQIAAQLGKRASVLIDGKVTYSDRSQLPEPTNMLCRFRLEGQVRGGKNNMIVLRNGMHIPKASWAKWRDAAVDALRQQVDTTEERFPWCGIVKAVIKYQCDLRRRDVPAVIDSLWHCIEKAGIMSDDALIKHVDFQTMGHDKPHYCEVTLLRDPFGLPLPCEEGGE